MVELGIQGVGTAELIGAGASATVFAATRTSIGDRVAIKVLKATLTDEASRRHFARESKALEVLRDCAGVVAILEVGETDRSEPYLMLPYFRRSARDLMLSTGGLEWRIAARIIGDASRSVHQAHNRGVFHRDLKPANLLVTDSLEVFVADFGVAALTGDSMSLSTFAGFSPAYAPPEAFEPSIEGRATSDVYGLAATFVALVTGRPPFHAGSGDSVLTMMKRVSTEHPPLLLEFGVPEPVAEVIRRALAKAPEGRQATAEQFAKELATSVILADAEVVPSGPVIPLTVQVPDWVPPQHFAEPEAHPRIGHRWKVPAVAAALALAVAAIFLFSDETIRPVGTSVGESISAATVTPSTTANEPTNSPVGRAAPVLNASEDFDNDRTPDPRPTSTRQPTGIPDPGVGQRQAALDGILVNYPSVRGEIFGNAVVLDGMVADETERALLDQAVRASGFEVQNNVVPSRTGSDDEGLRYSLNDLVDAQPELSKLRALLDQAGLGEVLAGDGDFTLFAPTNDAFNAIEDQVAELQGDTSALQDVLSYHLLIGARDGAAISAATTLPTLLDGQTIDVEASGSNIILNGTAPVLVGDANSSNGVMHVIGQVLLPDGPLGLPTEIGTALGLAPITFRVGHSDLTDEGRAELDKVVAYLLANPSNIEIGGHTDSDGDSGFNLAFSQGRAQTVMNYLVTQGVPAENLSAVGFGEDMPIVPNDSPANKVLNRRIEFRRT